ncbi:MAG: nitroreductase family protein [Nitrospirae bacterium]|nr:nitroreductase family protein [Nitrospirota bacterium]
MDIPYSRWYDAIAVRRSRRLFDSKPIPPDLLLRINAICEEFRPFEGVRAVLINQSADKVFKGAIGHYGKIKGATAIVAFIGDRSDYHMPEKVGYTGEGIILEATSLRIGTCWVGGFFRPEVAASLAEIKDNEKVFAVTPVGFAAEKVSLEEKIMTGFGMTHQRKPLSELVKGLEESKWPFWMKKALESAKIAPSAVNRQPWRFFVDSNSITISVDNMKDTYNIPKRLDCGIAMLHIEVASFQCGVKGEWEFLQPPQVARFKTSNQ